MRAGGIWLFGDPNEPNIKETTNEETRYIEIGHSYSMSGKIEVEVPVSITDKEDIIQYIRDHEDEYPIHPIDDTYIDGSYRVDLIYWPDGSDVDILD